MNVTVEELSAIKKKVVVEIAAEQVGQEIDKAYRRIGKTANLKGFRKGKIPQPLLEKHYAPRMEHDVVGSLINDSLFKALIDNKINAVSQPEVVDSAQLEKGKPFTYQAEVEVKPEVVAKDYTGLALEREKYEFREEVVDQRLEEMATARAQLEVTSRKKAREGDTVIIDFEGFVDGAAFENGAAKDYQLELGSNSFIPGFEEQLVGLKREESREVEVSFPENYGAKELAGKPALFKVELKEIKEKVQPKLNNDFAKELGQETIEELREQLKQDTIKQETGRVENQLQEQLMSALVENNPFEVPESMIQNQLDHLKQTFANRLQSQGMSLEMLGMNDEIFASSYREMAEQQVKGELLLEAIGKQEEIKAEDSEVDDKLKEIAEESNAPLESVQQYFSNPQARQGVLGQILNDKIIAFLLDKAQVTEVAPKQAEAEQQETEAKEG